MNARTRRNARALAPAGDGGAGRRLDWPGDPEHVTAAGIDFEALAHVLANTCRFGGRTRLYHSLAAHAVIASEEIEALDGLGDEERRRLALHALIADAPSAWLRGSPASSQRAAERTSRLSAAIERAVREAVGLDAALDEGHAELLRFVFRMAAAAERRDLPDADAGGGGVAFPPCKRRVRSIDPGRAARAWIERFRVLSQPPKGSGAGTAAAGMGGDTDNGGEEGDGARIEATGKESGRDAGRKAA